LRRADYLKTIPFSGTTPLAVGYDTLPFYSPITPTNKKNPRISDRPGISYKITSKKLYLENPTNNLLIILK
jgi:hypothetical protein